jgi:hypothetical protein
MGDVSPRLRRVAVITTVSVILASGLAVAQEASIVGRVTDNSGGVLPGVTVTATSPALQVQTITVVTDERGEYRITPLPIGTYEVLYSLPGFHSIKREGLRLTVGFVLTMDMVLEVGSVTETVTVSGASPVVDVTSTAIRNELTRETMELTPTARDGLASILAQAPGVRTNLDVGGNQVGQVPSFRAFGQRGDSFSTLDGVLTTSSKASQSGNFYDYSALEETQVQVISNDVDVPVRGISVVAVLKSGSNQWHGSMFWGQTNDRLQGDNLDENLRAQGITAGGKLENRWDRGAELGGKIIENKLWFYGSSRFRLNAQTVLNSFKDDGSSVVNAERPGFATGKASYQLNSANRIDAFYQWQHRGNTAAGTSVFVPWESRYDQGVNVAVTGAKWQATPTPSLVTSFQYGLWDFRNWFDAQAAPGRVATLDLVTQFQTGASLRDGTRAHEWRHHSKGSVSWYRPDLFHGNHEFKGGFDQWSGSISRAMLSRGDYGNYVLLFNSGVPFQLRTLNQPVDPLSSSNYLALYVRDSWSIARRLTLNLGARFAHDHGFVPAQCREDAEPPEFGPARCQEHVDLNTWNSVAPRLYASYDVTGKGKTIIKGGWGRFDSMREIEEVAPFNSITPTETIWAWHDVNNDRAYQPGEVNLNPNGPDFVTVTTTGLVGPFADGVPNPDEKQSKLDQFSLSAERELMANFGIRVTGIYSRNFNTRRVLLIRRPYDTYNIPITNPDPGPDNRVGTADDPGTFVTYYDYPAALAGRQFEQRTWHNPPGHDQTFRSIELAASKRLSRGWQLMASYSATLNNAPFPEDSEFTPNNEINVADRTWEWLGKASGTYVFPKDITLSARYEHRSGTSQARQVQFRGGRQIPAIVLNVEPVGSIRLPNINLVDLRFEKGFRLSGAQVITLWLNVYNVLNVSTVTSWNVRSGANYLRPTGIVPPRIAEFSVQYRF